jgi:1-acyl-sn-glycerol-3-phosphate acyltransferase
MTDEYRIGARGLRIRRALVALGDAVAAYTRFEFDEGAGRADGAALYVVNHGFGSALDLNVLLAASVGARIGLAPEAPSILLMHQLAWTLGLGQKLEPAGLRPAGREVALRALRAGVPVIVMPGGDLDGAKPWRHRNRVDFHGRTGFARLAQEAEVKVVPIVITGAGDTLLNLTDGAKLARALGLDAKLRMKALPIGFALPWGLSVGVAYGAYLPVPAKMRGTVCRHVRVAPGDDAEAAARAVEAEMDAAAHRLAGGRNPYLDWLVRPARWNVRSGAEAAA